MTYLMRVVRIADMANYQAPKMQKISLLHSLAAGAFTSGHSKKEEWSTLLWHKTDAAYQRQSAQQEQYPIV